MGAMDGSHAEDTPGDLTNPVSGERYVFREDAGDGALRWETYIAGRGDGPPGHLHPHQTERFQVRSGTMGASFRGREVTLGKGEALVVPRGVAHRIWNAGGDELHATAEMRPAAPRFREFLEAGAALTGEGRLSGKLREARLVYEYRDVIRPASPPAPVQRLIFPALAALARVLEQRSRVKQGERRSDA